MKFPFNRHMLLLARQSRGLSQIELAKKAGITQGAISKMESGLTDEPTADVIGIISQILRYPIEFFFQNERTYIPLSIHTPKYRKRSSAPKRPIEQLQALVNISAIHIKKLLSAVEFRREYPIPSFSPDDYGDDIANIAGLVRQTWKLPRGPIENLTEVAERAGIIVVHFDFVDIGVDGLTINVHGLPPLVFLDRSKPADRMRFTLAHEIGHIIMHDVPTPNIESEANAFASALLVPAEDIKPSFMCGKINIALLAKLKPYWKVSMAALLESAYANGHIDSRHRQYLWQQMSQKGFRIHEPSSLDFPVESPTILPAIFDIYMKQLEYKLPDLAKMLTQYEVELSQQYRIGPTIRLVERLNVVA